jgi:hypothetical protein
MYENLAILATFVFLYSETSGRLEKTLLFLDLMKLSGH